MQSRPSRVMARRMERKMEHKQSGFEYFLIRIPKQRMAPISLPSESPTREEESHRNTSPKSSTPFLRQKRSVREPVSVWRSPTELSKSTAAGSRPPTMILEVQRFQSTCH